MTFVPPWFRLDKDFRLGNDAWLGKDVKLCIDGKLGNGVGLVNNSGLIDDYVSFIPIWLLNSNVSLRLSSTAYRACLCSPSFTIITSSTTNSGRWWRNKGSMGSAFCMPPRPRPRPAESGKSMSGSLAGIIWSSSCSSAWSASWSFFWSSSCLISTEAVS